MSCPDDLFPGEVAGHYASSDLANAILTALRSAGKDVENLTPKDLAPVDEFHIRGREATLDLAELARLNENMHVLDVGSGIGGPSRLLALEYGCQVTGIDLTEDYCRAAEELARRLGLSQQVTYRQANALDLPFETASFDAVWTQHTAMNIPDKPQMYAEIHRVLKPGGTLAIYDICDGGQGSIHFPVPWAREPAISFLAAPEEMRSMLEAAGFEIAHWRITTDLARDWFRATRKRLEEQGPPPLGFHLLMGPDFQTMAQNMVLNLEENRIAPLEILARRV